jgi:hypothetical protein
LTTDRRLAVGGLLLDAFNEVLQIISRLRQSHPPLAAKALSRTIGTWREKMRHTQDMPANAIGPLLQIPSHPAHRQDCNASLGRQE